MNTAADLWRWADLKWLLAAHGLWVDLPRVQRDRAYALECIAFGLRSACAPARECGRQLRAALDG